MEWRGRSAPALLVLPLVAAIAVLVVVVRVARLASDLSARIRRAVASGPPLARAVARERDVDD